MILTEEIKSLDNQDENKELEKPSYTITEGNFLFHHFASLGSLSKERKTIISEVVTEENIAEIPNR